MNKMKIYIPLLLFISAIGFNSCSDEELSTESSSTKSMNIKETCEFEVHGVYIDNGMDSPTANNILVFPSYGEFISTIEKLELNAEAHDDEFLNQVSHLSDDEIDDLEDSINFNSDLPLDEFEEGLGFYSLRRHYAVLEQEWLDSSDSPNWSWSDDPTLNVIVEGVEQTVYNPYYEYIICNTLYKLTESGIVYIPVDHPNISEILGLINEGENPADVLQQVGGVVTDEGNNELNLPEPTVPVFESFAQNNGDCVYEENRTKRYVHPTASERSINAKQIMRSGPRNKVYKAVTKSYKWKRGKWRKRRTHIAAGLEGYRHDSYLGCPSLVYHPPFRNTIKKKKRREKSLRVPRRHIRPSVNFFGANNREFKTTHHQGVDYEIFYEN